MPEALPFQRGNPLFNGILGEFGNGVKIQLFHNILPVGVYRLFAHVQKRGDILA